MRLAKTSKLTIVVGKMSKHIFYKLTVLRELKIINMVIKFHGVPIIPTHSFLLFRKIIISCQNNNFTYLRATITSKYYYMNKYNFYEVDKLSQFIIFALLHLASNKINKFRFKITLFFFLIYRGHVSNTIIGTYLMMKTF